MKKDELTDRTRIFAVAAFKFVDKFPVTNAANVVTGQLLRCSSSVAANYRAVIRAKSRADFTNKMKIVLEEADESAFWLSFAADVGLAKKGDPELERLLKESDELTAIFTASVKTLTTTKFSNQKS